MTLPRRRLAAAAATALPPWNPLEKKPARLERARPDFRRIDYVDCYYVHRREQARDVAAGKCDLGIGNTYYWALMKTSGNQKDWADATKVILPTFAGGGTHVNLSGVVLAKNSPNKANAMKRSRARRRVARLRGKKYSSHVGSK